MEKLREGGGKGMEGEEGRGGGGERRGGEGKDVGGRREGGGRGKVDLSHTLD